MVRSPTRAVPSGSTASPHGSVRPVATTFGSSSAPASGPPGAPGGTRDGAARVGSGAAARPAAGPPAWAPRSGPAAAPRPHRSRPAAATRPAASTARRLRLMAAVFPSRRLLPVSPGMAGRSHGAARAGAALGSGGAHPPRPGAQRAGPRPARPAPGRGGGDRVGTHRAAAAAGRGGRLLGPAVPVRRPAGRAGGGAAAAAGRPAAHRRRGGVPRRGARGRAALRRPRRARQLDLGVGAHRDPRLGPRVPVVRARPAAAGVDPARHRRAGRQPGAGGRRRRRRRGDPAPAAALRRRP